MRCRARLTALVALAPVLLLCARAHGAPTQATCYTAFDADYFYFAAVVKRAGIAGSSVAPFGDPYADDGIAVFLTTEGASPTGDRAGRRVEMAVSVAGGAQLYRGADRTPLGGFQDFMTAPDGSRVPFKYRLRTDKPIGSPSEENGYAVEVAIPWVELDGAPQSGTRMRFNVCIFGPRGSDVVCLRDDATSLEAARSPQKWPEIVFVDAPVRSVSTAPEAKVCARVYNVKPVVDGAVAGGEWSTVTSFSFSHSGPGSPEEPSGAPAAPRIQASYEPLPAIADRGIRPAQPGAGPVALTRQSWPRMVLARYISDYQADPRKALPLVPVAEPSGRSTLVTHPMDGTGPWLTYDRVDWHRIQFTRMSEAGIQVAAMVRDIRDRSIVAPSAAAMACAALDAATADRPSLCLWLEASDAVTSSDLYDAIARFCYAVPEAYRTRVPLSAANGGGYALPVLLAPRAAAMPEDDFRSVRARFRRAFGDDLLLIGAEGDGGTPGLASVMATSAQPRDAALSVQRIAARSSKEPAADHLLATRDSSDYRAAWRQALASLPDWVVVDSWNGFRDASDIAPTTELGVEYLDATRAFAALFCDVAKQPLRIVRHTLPAVAAAGSTQAVSLTISNDGPTPWNPETAAIRLRSATEPSRAILLPLPALVEPGDVVTLAGKLPVAARPGIESVEVELVRVDKRGAQLGWSDKARAVRTLSIRTCAVDDTDHSPAEATVLVDSLPASIETASPYNAHVRLRNGGLRVWPKGSIVVARLFELDEHGDGIKTVPLAGAGAALDGDVAPGADADVRIRLAACRPDGTPLALSADAGRSYLLRWDVVPPAPADPAVCSPLRALQVVAADYGVHFINDYTPAQLPGGKRTAVAIGIRNEGPQAWAKGGVRIGYHWYSQDGLELVWEDETVALPSDLSPDSEIPDVRAWITAPAEDGIYWLVWDTRFGDTWASTRPSARAYETRVRVVEVTNGSLSHVDLTSAANRALCAPLSAPLLSGIDTSGRLLPSEITPPYAGSSPIASTLWLPEVRKGAERSRRLSFRWLPRTGANAVQCAGQRISVSQPRRARVAGRVHVLAAAARAGATVGVTLHFADGSEQYTSFPVSAWDGPPSYGETVAAAFPYTRLRETGRLGPAASVYHYEIRVKEPKGLVAVSLSESPDVCVTAITVER